MKLSVPEGSTRVEVWLRTLIIVSTALVLAVIILTVMFIRLQSRINMNEAETLARRSQANERIAEYERRMQGYDRLINDYEGEMKKLREKHDTTKSK